MSLVLPNSMLFRHSERGGDAWADVAGTPPLPYFAWACLLCAAERWLEQMFHVKQSGEDLRLETAFRKTRLGYAGAVDGFIAVVPTGKRVGAALAS